MKRGQDTGTGLGNSGQGGTGATRMGVDDYLKGWDVLSFSFGGVIQDKECCNGPEIKGY